MVRSMKGHEKNTKWATPQPGYTHSLSYILASRFVFYRGISWITMSQMHKPAATSNGLTSRPLSAYETMVRALSDRLVEAQRPIRILDAIKWDDDIERAFFDRGCRELPPVTRDYYQSRPLPFDPEEKLHEFHAIERDLRRQLGELNGPGQIMS